MRGLIRTGWVVTSAFVLAMLAGGCSSSDGGGGNSDCEAGCSKAAGLCNLDAQERQDCVNTCMSYSQEQISQAKVCADRASSCSEIQACIP